MENTDRSDYFERTRREVVTTAGFTVAGVSVVGRVRKAADETDEGVSYTAGYRVSDGAIGQPNAHDRPTMVEVRETVPMPKWTRVKAAHDAARRLNDTLRARFDMPATSVGVSSLGDRLSLLVLRGIPEDVDESAVPTEFAQIRKATPDRARGVAQTPDGPVERTFQVETRTWHLSPNYADGSFRPVPGGCKAQVGNGIGTSAQPVWNRDATEYQLLTAGHLYSSDSDDAWQPESNCGLISCDSPIGSAYSYEFDDTNTTRDVNGDGEQDEVVVTDVDAGTVSPASDIDVTYDLAQDGGGTTEDIVGYWSFDKIQMEQDNGTSISFQGHVSGRQSGRIVYTDSTNGWVVCEVASQSGDSGGPFYYANGDGTVDTVGVLSAGVDYSDDESDFDDATSFNAMSEIFDQLNLYFS